MLHELHEAWCRDCDEVFNPDVEFYDGTEHYKCEGRNTEYMGFWGGEVKKNGN